MQQAFQQTMNDSEFLAEMKKAKLGLDPVEGAEIENIVARMSKLEPGLANKLRDLLGVKK